MASFWLLSHSQPQTQQLQWLQGLIVVTPLIPTVSAGHGKL